MRRKMVRICDKALGIAFMETSAKESTNVQVAFERVLTEIYKIATKNAVQEIASSAVPAVPKGKKVEEDGGQKKEEKRVRLNAKQTKKKKSGGCC